MKKIYKAGILLTTVGGTLSAGFGLAFAQNAINPTNTKLNLNISKSEVENVKVKNDDSHASFNSMEDAGITDGTSAETVIKRYHLENGVIRFINGNGNRIVPEEVIHQIYGFGATSADVKIDAKAFPHINDILNGTLGIDYISEGLRNGITENYLNNYKNEITHEIQTFEAKDFNDTTLFNCIKSLISDGELITNSSKIKELIMEAVSDKGLFTPHKANNEWSVNTYDWFPYSTAQQGIWETLTKYNVKAMFNSVPVDDSYGKGPVGMPGDYFKDPVKNSLDRVGFDWIIPHYNEWRDINYGAKDSMVGAGTIRDAFSESARIALQHPWEKFDTSDGGKRTPGQVTPQGYLNDSRIASEMVPYFSKMQFGVMKNFGTRLAPYDVDNEPNIDIDWGHNFGLTPKQYSILGKGVHDELATMTKNQTLDLSNADPQTNDAENGGAAASKELVSFGIKGIDLTISLDSHSRLNADDTFGLWKGQNTPNNSTNDVKYGMKAYVDEVAKYWPEVKDNSILTYHTYWDYNPSTIQDVYAWATKGETEVVNKNYDAYKGIVSEQDLSQATHIDKHTTMITELSYNFWPDSKLDGDGMGGWGPDNETWFMALGYAYQMHSHSRYSRTQSFMPYHGGDALFSDIAERYEQVKAKVEENKANGVDITTGLPWTWKNVGLGNSKYLSKEKIYSRDLNGNYLKNKLTDKEIIQLKPGVTPTLHVNSMMTAGDRHLDALSNSIEKKNKNMFGDVWISEDGSKLKLFFVNDSESNKQININLDGYTANGITKRDSVDIINGDPAKQYIGSDVPMEHLSIMHGVSTKNNIGQVTQEGLLGIKYLGLDQKTPGRESRITGLGSSNLKFSIPSWGMYSVELDLS